MIFFTSMDAFISEHKRTLKYLIVCSYSIIRPLKSTLAISKLGLY